MEKSPILPKHQHPHYASSYSITTTTSTTTYSVWCCVSSLNRGIKILHCRHYLTSDDVTLKYHCCIGSIGWAQESPGFNFHDLHFQSAFLGLRDLKRKRHCDPRPAINKLTSLIGSSPMRLSCSCRQTSHGGRSQGWWQTNPLLSRQQTLLVGSLLQSE